MINETQKKNDSCYFDLKISTATSFTLIVFVLNFFEVTDAFLMMKIVVSSFDMFSIFTSLKSKFGKNRARFHLKMRSSFFHFLNRLIVFWKLQKNLMNSACFSKIIATNSIFQILRFCVHVSTAFWRAAMWRFSILLKSITIFVWIAPRCWIVA